MKKQEPEAIELSSEEGEALLKRLETEQLTQEDHQLLSRLVTSYFWLIHIMQETKINLSKLRKLLFGSKKKR